MGKLYIGFNSTVLDMAEAKVGRVVGSGSSWTPEMTVTPGELVVQISPSQATEAEAREILDRVCGEASWLKLSSPNIWINPEFVARISFALGTVNVEDVYAAGGSSDLVYIP